MKNIIEDYGNALLRFVIFMIFIRAFQLIFTNVVVEMLILACKNW